MIQPRHLEELARAFPHGMTRPQHVFTPDGAHNARVEGARVFLDGGELYDGTRDIEPERGFFPCREVVPAVALAENGRTVLFQIPTPLIVGGAPIGLVLRAELTKGWFGRERVELEPMVQLPQRAEAMALARDGTFAYGAEGSVFENPTGRAEDWNQRASFGQAQILGLQYLHDGALAVATQSPDRELPQYWLVTDKPEEVPLEQFAPEGRARFEWQKVRWTGVKFEQMEEFKRKNPALFDPEGLVRPHAACPSPSQRQALICTLGQAGQALLLDVATGSSRTLGQLDVDKLDRAYWDVDRERAAILSGDDLHVFDLTGSSHIVLPGLRELDYDRSDGTLSFRPPGHSEITRIPIHQAHTLASASWYPAAHDEYRKRLQGQLLGGSEKGRSGIQEEAGAVSFGGTRLKRRNG